MTRSHSVTHMRRLITRRVPGDIAGCSTTSSRPTYTLQEACKLPMFQANLMILQQPRTGSPERTADRPTRLVVRRSRNPESFHQVKQGSALQSEPGGRAARTTEHPVGLRHAARISSRTLFVGFERSSSGASKRWVRRIAERGYEANIQWRGARAAYCFKFAFLEKAKEIGLKFQRHVSDSIQE